YVNIAVAAAQSPGESILAKDTIHGIDGLPICLPVYRSHSYELLVGAISYITKIPAIYCFHWLATAFAAMLMPLAYAKLFRELTPKSWLWAVLSILVVLIAVGETHRWFGNFTLVRMWQGKALFLSVFTPLTIAYGLRFALRPRGSTWLLLASAQISAIGCTSSALWAIPIASGMALLSAVPLNWIGAKRLFLGALSSSYVLIVALTLKPIMASHFSRSFEKARENLGHTAIVQLADFAPWFVVPAIICIILVLLNRRPQWKGYAFLLCAIGIIGSVPSWLATTSNWVREGVGSGGIEQVESAIVTVLGNGRLWTVGVAALLVSWGFCTKGLAQRFAAISCLTAGLFQLNPLATYLIEANMTGPAYWRVLWSVPIPVLISLLLLSPLTLVGSKRVEIGARVLFALLLIGFAIGIPRYSGLSHHNRSVSLGWPRLKVEQPQFYWAQQLNQCTPPGSIVIAPPDVSVWIPVVRDHRFPLVVRNYLGSHIEILGEDDVERRIRMSHFLKGRKTKKRRLNKFKRGLEAYEVAGICLKITPGADRIRSTLAESGFEFVQGDSDFEVWVRQRVNDA
ncbi:MAG: hypothetical protein GY906_35575, partial [bacterium]|nr:hypothetical protein [bacterium]